MTNKAKWIKSDNDIPWDDVVGFDLVKLEKPWKDSSKCEFWYTLGIYLRGGGMLYHNHYMGSVSDCIDVSIYLRQLADMWNERFKI